MAVFNGHTFLCLHLIKYFTCRLIYLIVIYFKHFMYNKNEQMIKGEWYQVK